VNGLSTSLPPDIQEKLLHSIPGLENAQIMRYAYAIEYDYVNQKKYFLHWNAEKSKVCG
jgi:tRNA uridine 5-carboxymethylaminomethyl modification enzyme